MKLIDIAYSMSLPSGRLLFRVESIESLGRCWEADLRFLVRCRTAYDILTFQRLCSSGLNNLTALLPGIDSELVGTVGNVIFDNNALETEDIVALTNGSFIAQLLFRATDEHHTVFLTGQCDNYCLMCSQPPRDVIDTYLVEESIALSRYIPLGPSIIGFSGGEPLLLGAQLREVLDAYLDNHPVVSLEVLTNGRRLANHDFAQLMLGSLGGRVSWMVPLYGHADFLHDFVVQRHGAFDETLAGILNLQEFRQQIQLRVVLIEPVLQEVEEICRFVSMNLPFIQSLAFMGCEPIGFALANRNICDVELASSFPALIRAIRMVERVGINPVIMNIPLCCLPEDLRCYAVKSISNWKRSYEDECEQCNAKDDCGGKFVWKPNHWSRMPATPFKELS